VSIISIPGLIRGGQVEKYGDGDSWTGTVGAGQAATGGLLLESLPGDRLVRTAQAGSFLVCGVAMHDAAALAKVTVASEGVWMLLASGAIVAGNRVIAAAAGAVSAAGATPDARTLFGWALADAANGVLCPVKFC